jgi:hypothetical protein
MVSVTWCLIRIPRTATRWLVTAIGWILQCNRAPPDGRGIQRQLITRDEIGSQGERRKAKKRKVVSRYNEELPRHTETEVITQDPDEETKADGPYSVWAKCPPLTEKEECKEGENRNTQVRYEEEQWNLIKIENWTRTVDAFSNKMRDNKPE